MGIKQSIYLYLEHLDWFLIRRHPHAWHWRVEYLLFGLATANLLAIGSPTGPTSANLVVAYSFCVGNIWLNLVFGNYEHVYDGNGVAPLALAAIVIIQPITVFFGATAGSIYCTAFWSIMVLYIHKLFLFTNTPWRYSSSLLGTILAWNGGIFLFLLLRGIAIRFDGTGTGAVTNPVVWLTAGVEDAVFALRGVHLQYSAGTLVSGLSPLLPTPYGTYGQLDTVWCLAAIGAIPIALFLVVAVMALAYGLVVFVLTYPFTFIAFQKKRFLAKRTGNFASEKIDNLISASIAVPIWFLICDLIIRLVFIGHPIGSLMSTPGMIAVLAFIFFQTLSFQPAFNDYRSRM